MSSLNSGNALFTFLPPLREYSHLPVMQAADSDNFSLAHIAIAAGEDKAVEYATANIKAGLVILGHAAEKSKILVGFDINLLVAALKVKHGIVFERTVDTQYFLRFLTLADDFDNARALVGGDDADPIDVIRKLFRRMFDEKKFPLVEQYLANRTMQENLRGIGVDKPGAGELLRKMTAERDESISAVCGTFTGFDTNWLHKSAKVDHYVDGLEAGAAAKLQRMRHRHLSLSSSIRDVAKITGGPERIYFPLRYHGARTGRFTSSGRDAGRLNIHSLPARGGDDRSELLAEVRGLLVADDDESWISCDLANIEPRILAYLANEKQMLNLFAKGEDVYITFALKVFPDVKIVKGGENTHLRDLGKEAVISLGYGMRLKGFLERVLGKFPDTNPVLVERVYYSYDAQFPMIRKFRERLWKAFGDTFADGGSRQVGKCQISVVKDVETDEPSIAVKLPTWRSLRYRSVVALSTYKGNWRTTVYKYAPALKLGSDRQTREEVYETTLVNNVCQAIARDVLLHHQVEIERHVDLAIRFSVHDELLVSSPKCKCSQKDDGNFHLKERHLNDCPWILGKKTVKTVMSTVNSRLKSLKNLPIACELCDSMRDKWGK